MRRSREAKAEGHELIVQTGARLIRERGIEGTSVAEVMIAAGRTHGGFYRHFDTKTALVEACLDAAFDQMLAVIENLSSGEGGEGLDAFTDFYLSDDHVMNPGLGCPAAALASEIGRMPESVRQTFQGGVARMIAAMADRLSGDPEARRAEAMRRLSLMMGTVAMARSVDAPLSQAIRAAAPGA